jgi:hypothetical protein
MKLKLLFFAIFIFTTSIFAQENGSLSGQIYDSLGAVIPGANVSVVDSAGKEKKAIANKQGEFTVNGLAPGKYTVRVIAPKFSLYENTEVEIKAGAKEELIIALTLETVNEKVDIDLASQVSSDADANKSATVLNEKDLESLPDDPDELAAALQAMAGPSAGPNGGQFYIDGMTGGRMPPKEAIREIRINQNPFSAEFDRLGFGRVEILTKPGSDKWRGNVMFGFNDESLNSRNPFALNRAPSQSRNYNGNLSGPIKKGKSSFFLDVSERENDNNSVITAKVLDTSLNVVNFNQDVKVPTRRFSISPRFDYQINEKNTLVGRYSYSRNTGKNQGIGGFSLPSRATTSLGSEHQINFTETMIINPKTVNETRFQYSFNNREQTGDNTIPTISVADSFTGGGSQVGLNYTKTHNWEIQNYTTTSLGKKSEHGLKFGVRVRGVDLQNRSESNFGGTFTFAGALGLTSIEQYRRRILEPNNADLNPNLFTITTGNPLASVSQVDYNLFVQDDWRFRQDLTLNFGLRYENQTNISDNFNFAPRFGLAWSPGAGGARQPKTVIRAGGGIFFDRFSENNTLQAIRFDGVSQKQYQLFNATNSAILSQVIFNANGTVSNVPTATQLAILAPNKNTIRLVDPNAKSPYTMQGVISVERQLPQRITLSVSYIWARTINALRQRNINAPVCPPLTPCPNTVLQPNPNVGAIYQYETTGKVNTQFLNVNFRSGFGGKLTFFGNYRLGFVKGDTDGSSLFGGSFATYPMYSYDLSGEYGTAASDIRHNFFLGGSYTLPWNIRLNPFITLSSGAPFNITTGIDNNLDSSFNDRPAFATDLNRSSVVVTKYGAFDKNPIAGQTIIPRNYGRGPATFTTNLNLSKTFGFGGKGNSTAGNTSGQGGGNRGGGQGGGNRGGGGGPGGGGMMGGMFGGGGGNTDKPYNLTIGLNVQNLFNRVNKGIIVGNLSSPYFGQATSTGGAFGFFGGGGGGSANRRIDVNVRFSW